MPGGLVGTDSPRDTGCTGGPAGKGVRAAAQAVTAAVTCHRHQWGVQGEGVFQRESSAALEMHSTSAALEIH